MKTILLITTIIAFSININAQQTTYVGTSTGDCWPRVQAPSIKNGGTNAIEIKTYIDDDDNNQSFYGLMSFEFTEPIGNYEIKSAILRLTTRVPRGDRNMNIYGIEASIDADNVSYNDVADQINEALSITPIATFELNGQGNKALTDAGLSANYQNIEAWQNTIDITTFVASLQSNKFSVVIEKNANQNSSSVIYSKDYSDLTWNSGLDSDIAGTTIPADDVIPQLTIVFEMKNDIDTPIRNIDINTTRATTIYTISGQCVDSYTKGINIVNGKKILIK